MAVPDRHRKRHETSQRRKRNTYHLAGELEISNKTEEGEKLVNLANEFGVNIGVIVWRANENKS